MDKENMEELEGVMTLVNENGEEVELKQDLDDDGIQPVDDKAFTTVNDFEGQEGYGVVDAEDEMQEADQGSSVADDLFAGFANAFASEDDTDE